MIKVDSIKEKLKHAKTTSFATDFADLNDGFMSDEREVMDVLLDSIKQDLAYQWGVLPDKVSDSDAEWKWCNEMRMTGYIHNDIESYKNITYLMGENVRKMKRVMDAFDYYMEGMILEACNPKGKTFDPEEYEFPIELIRRIKEIKDFFSITQEEIDEMVIQKALEIPFRLPLPFPEIADRIYKALRD